MPFAIAQELAARHPDGVDIQILVAQIPGATPGTKEKVAQRISSLRRAYKLTPAHESTLAAVEVEIAKRQGISSTLTQRVQIIMQHNLIGPALTNKGQRPKAPLFMKIMQWPILRRIPGRLFALVVRPEHIQQPAA